MKQQTKAYTRLSPLLDYLAQNTATAILYGLLFGAIILFYSQVVGGYVTLFLVILLIAYAFSMTISFKAMKKLEKYEKDGCLTFPKIVRLSFRIACPIYWCWFLFAFVPIMSVDAWYITGFPITMVSAFPLKSVSDYWDRWRKVPYWGGNAVIYVVLTVIGQSILRTIFPW